MTTKRFLLTLTAIALVVTGCGGGDAGDPGGAEPSAGGAEAGGDGPSFIYVTPNQIGINKFLELGQVGTQRAAEKLGGTAKTFESTDQSSRRANIEAAVEEAPDIIVLTTFQFDGLADEFSRANPDQEFVLIDSCPQDPAENLHCGVFREYEAAYLLGVMAGNLTDSGVIGSVVATDIPFLHRHSDSFALGAASVDDSISSSQLFIEGDNPFSDPARAKEQALALAAQGADQIFAVGSGSNGGVFEAAQEQGFSTYGVDVDQCPDAPGAVVDSNLKHVDNAVEQMIDAVLAGEAGPLSSFGLAEEGTGVVALSDDLDSSDCLIAEHPDVVEQVRTAADEIIDGSLEIPDPMTAG